MAENENLVEAAKAGDVKAFAKLYEQYYREMYRYAFFLLGNVQEAEDVVMDTVADAFFGIRKLRDAARFKSWIFKILHNKARRHRGKVYIGRPIELPEEYDDPQAAGEMDRIEQADLLAAMATLSDEERSIVLLAVVAGYTSNEISEHMKLNANTVRSKQQRALLKLRKILEGKEEEPDDN